MECHECENIIVSEEDEVQCIACKNYFHYACWNQICLYSEEWGEFICKECAEKEDDSLQG